MAQGGVKYGSLAVLFFAGVVVGFLFLVPMAWVISALLSGLGLGSAGQRLLAMLLVWGGPVCVGAVVVLVAYREQRSRAWREAGRCGACGYDLRGTPDMCPECGTDTDRGEVGFGGEENGAPGEDR